MTERITNQFDEGRQPIKVDFVEGILMVTLKDGRVIGTPLDWYPRLLNASPEQLHDYELWPFGIHWEALDEDLSIEGMLLGVRPKPLQPQT
jgi:hypothetical protein